MCFGCGNLVISGPTRPGVIDMHTPRKRGICNSDLDYVDALTV